MRVQASRLTRFRPTVELLESRLQPSAVLPWPDTALPDPLALDPGLWPGADPHAGARIPYAAENPHGAGDTGGGAAASSGGHTATAGAPPVIVTPPATHAAPSLGVAGPAGVQSAAPLVSSHPAAGAARPIPVAGDQPHVQALADAVSVFPMNFATVQHWNAGQGGINPQTSLEWSTYVTGAADSATGAAVAVDLSNNVYVTGSAHQGGGMTAFVAEYTSDGTPVYYTEFQAQDPDPNFTYGTTVGQGIAVDHNGNAYVVGYAVRQETGNTQGFAMKLDPSGNVVPGYGGGIARTPTSNADGTAVAVNAAGQATLTGWFAVSDSETEIFAVKFNAPGTLPLYAVGYQFPGFSNSVGLAITLDASAANAYLAGWIQPSGANSNILIMEVDNAGAQAGRHASYALTAQSYGPDMVTGVAVDGDGDAFVSGTVTDPGSGATVGYAAEITPAGDDFLFAQVYTINSATGIAIDSAGNSYFTGAVTLDDGNQHAVIAKVDLQGNPVDATALRGDTSEVGAGIAFRGGSAFVVGTTNSTNLGTDGTTLNGASDAFLAKVDNFN
jgi:hypothetical protein